MPDFADQLKEIEALRERCRQRDEDLYRARLELHTLGKQAGRAQDRGTIPDPDHARQAADMRARMAEIEARLAALREEARGLEEWFAGLEEQQRGIDQLQRTLAALRERRTTLRQQLADLLHQNPPPADAVQALEDELRRLDQTQAGLENQLGQAEEALHQLRGEADQQRSRQADVQGQMDGLRQELRDRQAQLADLQQPVFRDPRALAARQHELEQQIQALEAGAGDCAGQLGTAIGGLYGPDPHPRDGLRRLDDRTPFLLFPLRLETIFVPIAGSNSMELWVRVYPDEISVHTHEKILTGREVAAGELYWTELVAAEHLRGEQDARRRAAWRSLVDLLGGQRAAWVAQQTKPTDWDPLSAAGAGQTLPDFLRALDPGFFTTLLALDLSSDTRAALQTALTHNDGDAFSRLAEAQQWYDRVDAAVRTAITGFPSHDLTKTDAWTRAPRAQDLPDRLVLLLYPSDTAAPRQITGNLIPNPLILGPDPLDPKSSYVQTSDPKKSPLTYGSAFDWMSDFDQAVAKGMGFRVRLSAEEARAGFARIMVLGVLLSAGKESSAALLEELIGDHQYSPSGFSLVPQGTPTNNTEKDGSGYSANDAYNDRAFFTALDPPAFDPSDPDPRKSQADGRLLADALGISYGTLQTIQHADQIDVMEGLWMGTALFPGTWGYWLRTWMPPVVTDEAARQTRTFFTRYVSGRGPLPAVRVGNQPYGVLLTSDFSRWKYPAGNVFFDDAFRAWTVFLTQLSSLLAKLETLWDGLARDLPFIGKPGLDPSDTLMKILGLQPTSAEFYQRVGYTAEYLRNLDRFKDKGRYANELNSLLLSLPATARLFLQDLGVEETIPTVAAMRSLHVLWQHYTTPLDIPNLVEKLPPSETRTLAVNYIDWLANAETAGKILNQDFGAPPQAQPPSALLYMLLRNAILLQMHHGAFEWITGRADLDAPLQQSIQAPALPQIRASAPAISKIELMSLPVEKAVPDHPFPGISVADWIWSGPQPAEIEAAFLREQKSALQRLAQTPTARLERLLLEHLDTASYRLDAWQTGLFAERLQTQRGAGGQERRTGIYLGAYGWVENVRPEAKQFLAPEALPAALRPEDAHPVLEEDDAVPPGADQPVGSRQGGFVHAPSLNHASAAALLRNAYLSHARPDQAEMFAVNLSSERVRRGQFVLEGMRNGQPIEALLGYQFERQLHDLTSQSAARGDVPVLELNEFILPYRQAFPFEARELPQAGTGPAAETVPPYSVVNGLKLAQADLSAANAFGLDAVLPAGERPGPAQGAAILSARDALLDTLDAVKDLLMAENAYQLVRGNFDRVAAISLAQKEARIPPALEVIDTPRGTTFTFTNRVTLHFADLDPTLPASNPWHGILLTPRAWTETGLNAWLGQVLGPQPEKIRCDVYWVEKAEDGPEKARDLHPVFLADLGLQPVDFVWLAGSGPADTGGATELETRIACRYRLDHAIADDKIVRIAFHPAPAAGEQTFAQLFPLTGPLRLLISKSRALHAGDFLPASGGKETAVPVDKNNPKGYDAAELRARVLSARDALTLLADALDGPAAPSIDLLLHPDPQNLAVVEPFSGPLGAAFDKLEAAKLSLTDPQQVEVTFASASALRETLVGVAAFGISDAFPPETDFTPNAALRALLARAQRTARRLRRAGATDGLLDRANALLSQAATAAASAVVDPQVSLLLAAGQALFGDSFDLLPKFTYANEPDLAAAFADRAQILKHATALGAAGGITGEDVVEEWLMGAARVRPALHRWEVIRALADALNDVALDLQPIQAPYRANDSWLAVTFPEKDPNPPADNPNKPFGISRDTLSIAAHGGSAFQPGLRRCGLLVDEWTEEIPTAEEITGITFRFNQPNAAPPQALLLVVTPEETGSWDWDALVGALNDTLRRAKRRAVEPDQLEELGSVWNTFAPALLAEFSAQLSADISLDLITMMDYAPVSEFYSARAKKV